MEPPTEPQWRTGDRETMSPAPTTQDKRADLTAAAQSLFYEQGYGATSVANVAERAGVPLGNVY